MNTLIIGYGIVGQNMHKIFPDAYYYDPAKNGKHKAEIQSIIYDIAFVCVPTPPNTDGSCNTEIVEKAIVDFSECVDVFCIKSTVPPGTTERLSGKRPGIVFSPEYFGSTQHANSHYYNFVILGGDPGSRAKVAELYKSVMPGSFKIYQTDSKTAELTKYMENSWIAAKVSFCCEFSRIADTFGVDNNELRELFLADPRVNPSHTFVYNDSSWYDSNCLNKDIPAIIKAAEAAGYNPALLKAMHKRNDYAKSRGKPCR